MRRRALLTAAAAAAGLLGFAVPTSASSGAAKRFPLAKPTTTGVLSARPATSGPAPYFAGYWYDVGLASVNVTTSFVVPKTKCGSGKSAVAAGLNSFSSGGAHWAVLLIVCRNGQPRYEPVLISDFTIARGHAVHAGDTVLVHERANSGSVFLSITDKADPQGDAKLTTAGGTNFTPEIGDLKLGGTVPIANFGKITFTKSSLNGKPFGSYPVLQYHMVNGSTVQVTSGPFASNQESFKTTFRHS